MEVLAKIDLKLYTEYKSYFPKSSDTYILTTMWLYQVVFILKIP